MKDKFTEASKKRNALLIRAIEIVFKDFSDRGFQYDIGTAHKKFIQLQLVDFGQKDAKQIVRTRTQRNVDKFMSQLIDIIGESGTLTRLDNRADELLTNPEDLIRALYIMAHNSKLKADLKSECNEFIYRASFLDAQVKLMRSDNLKGFHHS